MGAKRRELVVAMNGREIGRLRRVSNGELEFEYATPWLADAGAIPLSLAIPLRPGPLRGDVVWNHFDNLLPDSRDTRERLQQAVGAESTRPFDLLSSVGADCVGAVQLIDALGSVDDLLARVRSLEAEAITDAEIAERLRSLRTRPLGMTRADRVFRISIAGAQYKTALLRHGDDWKLPHGPTPTTHILKLPIGPLDHRIDLTESVENEWLCARVLEAFGLEVAKSEIVTFDGVLALVVERFDRRWAQDRSWIMRLPQEDLCQAFGLGPGKKYEQDGGPGTVQILELLLGSRRPQEDREAFFRAQIVFWMLAAIDGHAKNFSVALEPKGRFRLCPIYDVLSAHPLLRTKALAEREIEMAMAAIGKNKHYLWSRILPRHWLSTAERAEFPVARAQQIVDECAAAAPAAVEAVAARLPAGFPPSVSDPILAGVLRAAERLRG